jgi:hypothetical protein
MSGSDKPKKKRPSIPPMNSATLAELYRKQGHSEQADRIMASARGEELPPKPIKPKRSRELAKYQRKVAQRGQTGDDQSNGPEKLNSAVNTRHIDLLMELLARVKQNRRSRG